MFKTSYRHEVRKEKKERTDVFEEPISPEMESAPAGGPSTVKGWESLQELNSRFAGYINRARVLEQRNAVFRKQLETLQRMEEAPGLEEVFSEQISVNRQRIRELLSDRPKLERELKDAERMLDEYNSRYRNECEYQEQLRHTLEQLNKEADTVLLRNLDYQIQLQFLQDDVNATKERHKKNLTEIQMYLNILHQINQTIPLMASASVSKDQERLNAQRCVPALRSQMEEYKSAICQLQAQKQRLQTETSVLEQTIKTTQESCDDEIQLYNGQIETLRKEIEEAERSLEKYTNDCRQLAMYQTSLESELERYTRIIENEDNRLNSAIIGTPITLLTTNYKYSHSPSMTRKGKDITQVIQDITNVKPRQKYLAKKVFKKKEITSKGASRLEDKPAEEFEEDEKGLMEEQGVGSEEHVPREDVPDGAQISKAFDTLCNIIRDRMRRVQRPEPIADFFTRGRYVLVTGDSSYLDPCFFSTTPSASHVYVTIQDGMMPYDPYWRGTPSPVPSTPSGPTPLTPSTPSEPEMGKDDGGRKEGGNGERGKSKNGEPHPKTKEPEPSPSPPPGPHDDKGPSPPPGPRQPSPQRGGKGKTSDDPNSFQHPPPMPSPGSIPPDSMTYEKVEVVESVEKLSHDKKVKGYEETTTVVETMIEKTSRKKHADRSS
ncbi:filensin-like [Sinocyclocheilus rhinocerous]|uniref:filensin-like n=1 Tax=Sinocyclocheilus rhinocerous TaxID=307959 RepID=UPI0007BA7C39|nr:PREDICTED: filensin-like [Sinocyclocheilus rhinocerous]